MVGRPLVVDWQERADEPHATNRKEVLAEVRLHALWMLRGGQSVRGG